MASGIASVQQRLCASIYACDNSDTLVNLRLIENAKRTVKP